MTTRINILSNDKLKTSELRNSHEGTIWELEFSISSVPDSAYTNEELKKFSSNSNASNVDVSKVMSLIKQMNYCTHSEKTILLRA